MYRVCVSCVIFWLYFESYFKCSITFTPRDIIAAIRPGYKNIQNLWSHVTTFYQGLLSRPAATPKGPGFEVGSNASFCISLKVLISTTSQGSSRINSSFFCFYPYWHFMDLLLGVISTVKMPIMSKLWHLLRIMKWGVKI